MAVHDAVRPFIDSELVEKVIAEAAQTGAAIVGIVPVDTVKRVHKNKIRATLPREHLVLAQTPQVFRFDLLKRAFERARQDGFTGTDESSLVERLEQVEVSVVQGSDRNIKITKPTDMDLARLFLAEEVDGGPHRDAGKFAPAWAGTSIASRRASADPGRRDDPFRVRPGRPLRRRHSVARHHRCAAGRGRAGRHRDAFSGYRSAMEGRRQRAIPGARREAGSRAGYEIVNVDTTVILERPKLKDYRVPIRESLARTLALELDRVSVKFKTAERVGPVGEGRSAEAQAIVTLSNEI